MQIRISVKIVCKGLIDNKPTSLQVLARRGIGDKPLPELMLTHFPDVYIYGTRGDELKHGYVITSDDVTAWVGFLPL